MNPEEDQEIRVDELEEPSSLVQYQKLKDEFCHFQGSRKKQLQLGDQPLVLSESEIKIFEDVSLVGKERQKGIRIDEEDAMIFGFFDDIDCDLLNGSLNESNLPKQILEIDLGDTENLLPIKTLRFMNSSKTLTYIIECRDSCSADEHHILICQYDKNTDVTQSFSDEPTSETVLKIKLIFGKYLLQGRISGFCKNLILVEEKMDQSSQYNEIGCNSQDGAAKKAAKKLKVIKL